MVSDIDWIYIEILEMVLMSILDFDLWKFVLQKLVFFIGSVLMEFFNVKFVENVVVELLVWGMMFYIWVYLLL